MALNLKALSFTFASMCVMGMAAVSNAPANYVFTSPVEETSTTGQQVGNHEFIAAGQVIKCATANFTSTVIGTEIFEVAITPTYGGCTYAAGAKAVHPTINGCVYVFTGLTTADGKHGKVHLECPAGKVIEVHLTNFNGAETCTLTVGSQTLTEGYTATNNGNHVDILATAGVKIAPHGKGGCPLLVIGKYVGSTTLEGFVDGQPHGAGSKVNIDIDS